ncbi:MAG TPA: RDD family protein [Opitutaceae bacterium]|nr:RDD family protein [Opitutaceae bacterium]
MFTIIGGDGKEYGPATAEQLRAWIAAGRANLDTKAKALGTEEWRRLGDFAEFSSPTGAPPVMGASYGAAPQPAAPAMTAPADAPDRGTRLAARCIDWAIAIVAAIPGTVMLGGEFMKLAAMMMQGREPDINELDMARVGLGGLVLGLGWLIVLVIQIVMLSTRGQSIGKRLMRLRVVRLDGTPAGFVHAWLLRECLITVIGVFLSVFPVAGPLLLRPAFHVTDWCMIFRDDHRCLHDLIAGTRVVRA